MANHPKPQLTEYPHAENVPDHEEHSDDWLLEPDDPQRDAFLRAADAYVNDTLDPETGRGFTYGFTPQQLSDWRAGLSKEEGDYYDEQLGIRYAQESLASSYDDRLHEGLTASAPELLLGRLPKDQERLLDAPGYVLGTNQAGVFNLTEAEGYIAEAQGIDFTAYNLNNRFQFFDPEVKPAIIFSALSGYFGEAGGGSYVIAVPDDGRFAGESVVSKPDSLLFDGALPDDFITEREVDGTMRTAVSPKYIAGFIDMEGRYHPNTFFMQNPPDGPQFSIRPSADEDWL